MFARLDYIRERLGTSFWLIPLGLCLLSGLLGILMLWIDRYLGQAGFEMLPEAMPLSSARQILGVIAGSIITVGGVAFSVTMVALTLTSGQYGPKILRNFLDDDVSKVTLGLFLGTYVYTLLVLTGLRQTDQPHFSVFVSLLLSFSALVAFVGFIHRTATDLQADEIIHRIGVQLEKALEHLVAETGSSYRTQSTLAWRRAAGSCRAYPVAASTGGYIQAIDYAGLVKWCVDNDSVLQVRASAGDFIVPGVCLFKIFRCSVEHLEHVVDELNSHVVTGPIRTPVQDPEHAITQLNQLVARALSPGINDPGTAITCIDRFSLGLSRIVDRDIPGPVFLDEDRQPRLLVRTSTFQGILDAIYTPLRQFTNADSAVALSLLDSLCRLAALTRRTDRLRDLALHGREIVDRTERQVASDRDLHDIRVRHLRLQSLLSVAS